MQGTCWKRCQGYRPGGVSVFVAAGKCTLISAVFKCGDNWLSPNYYLIAEAQGKPVTMNDDNQLLTHHLRAHVTSLAAEIGERNVFKSEALRRAAAYIEAEWGALGYGVERLEYDVAGIRCANLVATREGSTRRNEILLLGAHYDSVVGSPGANDNASGVAALLEISRMFQALERALTVRFVAFVNEEPPFFWTDQQGSLVYAQAARRRGDDIRLMASLETIGCYSSPRDRCRRACWNSFRRSLPVPAFGRPHPKD